MRWWCSNLGQGLLRTWAPSLLLNLFLVSPDPPSSAIFWIFVSPLKPTPTTPPIYQLSLLHPLLPPNLPDAEHLYTWTSPPTASLHCSSLHLHPLPSSTFSPGFSWPLYSCATCLWIMCPLSVGPPFATLILRPGPFHPLRVSPSEGSPLCLPSSVCLPLSPSHPPPLCWPWLEAQYPDGTKVFVSRFYYLCPLWIRLALLFVLTYIGVLWFLVSLLCVLLRWSKRPGHLHTLVIVHPDPCPMLSGILYPFRPPSPPRQLKYWVVALEVMRTHTSCSHGRIWLACKTKDRMWIISHNGFKVNPQLYIPW